MTISRYSRTPTLDLGQRYGTSRAIPTIRRGIENGTITFTERTMAENMRLDVLAADEYGDGRYWWIIAAASNIGWAPQVPPGTYVRIPNLAEVLRVVG
jgi:hypothetical protein